MPRARSHPVAWSAALTAALGCAASPQVQDDLDVPYEALVATMREAAAAPVPLRPPLYELSGSWVEQETGSVVAIDGPMLAVRLDRPDASDLYFHCVVPIADGQAIKGDGIVVMKFEDLLVCRYFENRFGSRAAPRLGDRACVDRLTTEALRRAIVAGTAEWYPAPPSRR